MIHLMVENYLMMMNLTNLIQQNSELIEWEYATNLALSYYFGYRIHSR